jgi:hypothetical protein
VALAVLVAAAAGCRLDVVAEVVVDPDGTGTVALAFHLDDALLDQLDELGVDPTGELSAAALDDDTWELERAAAEDGEGLTLTLQRAVPDPATVGEVLSELAAGLAPDDPALVVDVEVAVDEAGASAIDGTIGFRGPATAGATVDGEPLGPHGDELATIVATAVVPVFVATLPGEPTTTDADHLDGTTMRWEVPSDGQRTISARAAPAAPWWDLDPVWLAVGAGALVLVVLIVVLVRRRRRRRRAQAIGFV